MKNLSLVLCALVIYGSTYSQNILLNEDFEDTVFPSGWTISTNATDGGWNLGTNQNIESQWWSVTPHGNIIGTNDDDCDCDKSMDYLIMPPGIADSAGPQFTGVADVAIFEFNSTNQVVQQILPAQQTFTLAPIQLGQMQGGNLTLADFDTQFDTLAIGNNAGSQTFDADSVTGDSAFPKLSSNNQLLLNFSNDFF